MERRTFLKAAVIAGATPAAAWAPPTESLASLFAAYEAATKIDWEAWGVAADLEDCEAMKARPLARVQVARREVGRTSNDDKIYEPVFVRTAEEIERRARLDLDIHLLIVSSNEILRRRAEEKYAERVALQVGQLNDLHRERQRIEDECGFTAAMERARAASAAVRAIENAILDFVPVTLDEAARKARWIVAELQGDRAYMHEREDVAEVALSAIGKAVLA